MSVCIVTVTAPIVGVTAIEHESWQKGLRGPGQNNIGTDICFLNVTNYHPV
jgi:hypothetical protein